MILYHWSQVEYNPLYIDPLITYCTAEWHLTRFFLVLNLYQYYFPMLILYSLKNLYYGRSWAGRRQKGNEYSSGSTSPWSQDFRFLCYHHIIYLCIHTRFREDNCLTETYMCVVCLRSAGELSQKVTGVKYRLESSKK